MKLTNLNKLFAAVLIALLPFGPAMAINTKTSVEKVTTEVALTDDVDYIITDATPFSNSGVVDIQNTDHAVLILSQVKPSAALKLLASHVKVNGEKAVNNNNCQVKLYNRGCIIMPYAKGFKPLTVYSEQNFQGEAVNDFGLENSGGFMNTLTNEKLNNRIRSFKLKRGYMVTFANRARGRGYSRCFIAADQDLEVPMLPGVLDNSISSYRIFQWFDAGKPQLAAATGDDAACSALNVTSTYTWSVGVSMAPNVESVVHHIYEDFPSPAACGGATWTPHMKTNNEPKNGADDHPQDLATILANWENLMATGMRLCSPSSWDGSDYWNGTGFLKEFFDSIDARGWRCDIIDMHCYWAGNFGNLKNWVNAVHRPIWISEWCWGASWNSNGAFASGVTENNVRDALSNICNELNGMDFVERYFYWNGERDPSRLYKSGKLTPAGEMYAQLDGGLAYNGKYDYVPKVPTQQDPSNLVINFDKNAHTAALSWYEPNGEMNTSVSVERRKSATDVWTVLAQLPMRETGGKMTYEDGEGTNGCQYRIHVVDANGKDRYTNIVTAASDDLGAGDSVELDGVKKYIGGNIFTNGTFDMGSYGWTNGVGGPLDQPWFQVVPVGGYENSPYLQAYGHDDANTEAAIKNVFDIKANTDYYYSAMAANTNSIYAQLCFTEDGDKSAKIIKYLNNTTANWLTTAEKFNSGEYTKVLLSFRSLGAKTRIDNLLLAQLFDTEEEAIADGVEKARLRAQAFIEYNSFYPVLNQDLERILTTITGTGQEALFALERAVAQAIQAYNILTQEPALLAKAINLADLGLDGSDQLKTTIETILTNQYATAQTIIDEHSTLQAAIDDYLPMTVAATQPQQPKFATATGWTTKCGTYTGGDQRTNKVDGVTFWNAWWSGISASEGTAKTMEVKQDVKGLAHGLYTLECKASTEHFCLSDQHAYLKHGNETAVSPALTADYFDLSAVSTADRWQTLTTDPIYVNEDDTVTIGFVGSKAGAIDNAWREVGNKDSKGDKREGWWCATDFVLKRTPLYKAKVTPGQWAVACLPYAITPGKGVTMYQIVGVTADYTKLCVEPIEKSLAGMPFIYTSETSEAILYESGDETKKESDAPGNLSGYFKTTSRVLANYYYLENGQWYKCTQKWLERPLIGNFSAIIRPFNDSSAQPVTIYKGWRGLTIPINGITDEEKDENDSKAQVVVLSVPADVNGDGVVDVADIASIISVMASRAESEAADVNGDGVVDVADISSVISTMAAEARGEK